MPINTQSLTKKLYDLLKTRGYDPIAMDSDGERTPVPEIAEIFKFTFKKNGKDYGNVWVTIDDLQKLVIYFDDSVADSGNENTSGTEYTDSWSGLLKHLKNWSLRHQLSFDLRNRNHLASDMAQRSHMKKEEQINEGYYPMGKTSSYNDSVPTVKIVLQHTRQIQEGEQRYRNVAKIYLENQQGERILAPTNKPGIAQIYARHLAEGGVPNDERWNHIKSLCEEYTKMAGFVRAVRGNQFNESAQKLVNEGINHYQSLRETLSKMTGHRGYNAYFENYTPALMEDETDNDTINELFVQETMDPRIESVMPILSRLHKKVNEMSEVKSLEEWADSIISEKMVMGSGSDASSAGSYKMGEATDLTSIPEDRDVVKLNGKTIDPSSIELGGVHRWDHPDYSDAYIEYAEFDDGTPLSDEELDQLTDERSDLVNQMANHSMYGESVDEGLGDIAKKVGSALKKGAGSYKMGEEGVVEADKHSFIGKIQRGHELKKKVDQTWKDAADAEKRGDEKGAVRAFNKHVRYTNLERPGTWRTVKDEGVAEDAASDAEKKIKIPAALRKDKVTLKDLEKAKERNISGPEGLKALKQRTQQDDNLEESDDCVSEMTEAYDPWDEGDMWYRIDPDSGVMKQRLWKHAQNKEAKMNGWADTQEKALRMSNIIRSKFDSKKFVKKVGNKWVQVYPYGNPGEQSMAEDLGAQQEISEIGVPAKRDSMTPYPIKYPYKPAKALNAFANVKVNPGDEIFYKGEKLGIAIGGPIEADGKLYFTSDPRLGGKRKTMRITMGPGVEIKPNPLSETEVSEDLDANQKRVGQLGPTEKVGKKGAVGKLVGANESIEHDPLLDLKRLLGK